MSVHAIACRGWVITRKVARMQSTPANLRIELVWLDSDMVELQLSAISESFAGRTNFYAGYDELPGLAALLEGFPSSSADVRTFEFGRDGLPGYGRASVRLYCRDSSGHLVAEVSIATAPAGLNDVAEAAVVQVDTVPADIDSFIEQLRSMGSRIGATATLMNAT